MNSKIVNFTKKFVSLITLGIVMVVSSGHCLASATKSEIRDYLLKHSIFSSDDLSKLNSGEIIAALLPVNDDRDVAVCGLVSINAPPETGLKAFHDTMSRENKGSVLALGNFSEAPKIEDINSLSLDDRDIEDIRVCRPGDCRVRLSATMIERFQKEINWKSDGYSQQVNKLYREMILDYVENYLLKGDPALIEYRDQRDSLRLQDDQISLLKSLLWINEFAPEFSEYLRDFPTGKLENVKNSVSWSKIKFGLKPVIVITHTSKFKTEKDGVSQIFSVSKQIYASHYFDSSLGLTALVKFANTDSGTETYLFYTNHSRSTSLGGTLSKFKHKIVDKEALEKIEPLLRSTRALAESRQQNKAAKPDGSNDPEVPETVFGGYKSIWLLGLIAIIAVIFLIGKIMRKI